MPFAKGQISNPKGRKKGIPNKQTSELKEVINKFVSFVNHPVNFQKICDKLIEDRPEVLLNFLAKIAPKDINIEVGEKTQNPVLEQITAMRKAIEDKNKVIEVKAEDAK